VFEGLFSRTLFCGGERGVLDCISAYSGMVYGQYLR
jgi:hypothetical protein